MTVSHWQRRRDAEASAPPQDAYSIGRRLHAHRKRARLTLAAVSDAVGVTSSQLSQIENGKREAKLSTVQRLATLYGVTLAELITSTPNRRTHLEIELAAAMNSPLAYARGLPPIRVGPTTPLDVLEAMVALHRELQRLAEEHIATPEEARRANTDLRRQMRERGNYYGEIEAEASALLAAVGHAGGALTTKDVTAMVRHLNFTLAYVSDLPHSTRSVTDLRTRRIYLARSAEEVGHDRRSVLLQALGHQILGHTPPSDYAEFLRQRVETNYFAGALSLPEASALAMLTRAKADKDISVAALQDAFGVSYETAAHRITNVATQHLGLPLHFAKVHESGTIYKAYENDGTRFPMDPSGAIEGQPVCRFWPARQVFEDAGDGLFAQFTDTPQGTYWGTATTERTASGTYSLGLGTSYVHAKWFRGRDTRRRTRSTCPDEACCRRPPANLLAAWGGKAWPSARARTHMMAALPPGAFPGVDETEVYAFLESHRTNAGGGSDEGR